MKYVALLRGINVGGKNKVDMKELKALFIDLGYTEVQTYINSGNVIFDTNQDKLKETIEEGLLTTFNLVLKVLIIDIDTLEAIVNLVPDDYVNDSTMRCDVIFLMEGMDSKEFLESLKVVDKVDTVLQHDRAIIWKYNREDVNKSGQKSILSSPYYKDISIRNVNTVRKLLAL